MGGTRIIVWKMKDLIKIGIIAVIGLAAVILLVIALTPSGGGNAPSGGARAVFVPGTYTAQIILQNEPVNINVTVNDREITAIEMTDMRPNQELMYPLFRPTIESLSTEIIRRQTTNVSVDSGAVITSTILLSAINNALEQAMELSAAVE